MNLLPFDYAVRNLGRSPRRLVAIVVGNTLVVLLILAAAAFVEGMRESLSVRHDSRNVILVGAGSEESLQRSEVPATTPGILAASLSGIHSVGGAPFVSAEVFASLVLYAGKGDDRELRGLVRGVTSGAFLVHDRVEMTAGRPPRTGANEIIAGSLAAEKLGLPPSALDLGESLWIDGQAWTIVGRFQTRGTIMDAELWMPLNDLQVITRRSSISCVVIRLGSAEFADVDAFTKMRIDLELSAIREADYYAALQRFYRPIQVMIWVTALLIALAGILGGLNTLYSAFAARVREIGMLQVVGFSRRAIVVSLMQEALLAAAVSVFLAILIAWLALDGIAVAFSMGVFLLTLNSAVLTAGGAVGLFLGVIGALPPAWRCLRMPIPEALKSL